MVCIRHRASLGARRFVDENMAQANPEEVYIMLSYILPAVARLECAAIDRSLAQTAQ